MCPHEVCNHSLNVHTYHVTIIAVLCMSTSQGGGAHNVLVQCEVVCLCLCLLHPCYSPSLAQTGGKMVAISGHMMKNRMPQVSGQYLCVLYAASNCDLVMWCQWQNVDSIISTVRVLYDLLCTGEMS